MARSEITLGFIGSGKVEKRNAYALLRDLIDASGGAAKFIFPLTRDLWNPALDVVSAYAIENNIPVEAIVDDTTAKTKELKTLLAGARRQHQSAAPSHKMAALLEEAKDGRLIVLWEDEDELALDAVRAADEKGIPLLELTRGLDRIELVAGDDEEDEEPVEDEVPEDDVVVGQDEDEIEPTEESDIPDDEGEGEGDEEAEEEAEFPEAEAEEDLEIDSESEDGEDIADEFPGEEEEFTLPEEEDSDVAVLDVEQDIVEEVRQVTGMSEFQRRLLTVLENTSDAFVKAIDALLAEAGSTVKIAPALKPAIESKSTAAKSTKPIPPARPAKKTTAPAKKAAEKPTVKRTVPSKKAPAKAETNGTGKMSKAAAQKIIDSYRPRRGRPPAEVTEARKILGLA